MNYAQQFAAAQNNQREEARPFVQFEMRAQEDRSGVSPDGVTHTIDVPWAIVRAPGSRDSLEKPAREWLEQLKQYAHNDRIPRSWPRDYTEAFELWLRGEELPLHGTALKSWPPLSPAQRKNALALGLLTVESLAQANSEVLARLGMGAHTLKQLAVNWLTESKDKGSMAQSLEAALVRLEAAEKTITAQAEQIKALTTER